MNTEIVVRGRVVRPGLQFQHANLVVRLPDGTIRPDVCTIIGVRRGLVRYRTESGYLGAEYPSHLANVILRWLEEGERTA